MRVRKIHIDRFRNLRDVHMRVPDDARLICLVGENGTGKSSILDLIVGATALVGEPGRASPRGGGVFLPNSEFSLLLEVDELFWSGVSRWHPREQGRFRPSVHLEAVEQWGRDVRVTGKAGSVLSFELPSVQHHPGYETVIEAFQHITRVRDDEYRRRGVPGSLVVFEPNRTYGNVTGVNPVGTRVNPRTPGEVYRPSFEEIIRVQLQAVTEWETQALQLLKRREPDKVPPPPDPIDPFSEWLTDLFPHIGFSHVDDQTQTVIFDVGGDEVTFGDLSTGEQEAIVQELQVRNMPDSDGLVLFDEPELRLHPDLLRRQLGSLRDAIGAGQIWAATHSFEAAELAGPEATFVFTRSDDTHASTCFRWADRPGFAVLARALGMPAFSLTARPFVVIESEDGWERDLVERLVGMRGPSSPRYLAVGGKDAVAAVLRAVRPLVADAGGRLRVGGIVDRDHDDGLTLQGFNPDEIHVLGCHDLENLFLHPDAIDPVQPRARRSPEAARATVRDASDRFAGVWIVERTQSRHRVPRECFDLGAAKGRDWRWWNEAEGQLGESITKPGVAPPPDHMTALLAAFAESIGAYRSLRISDDLWRFCSGKEVLGHIPHALGLNSKREIIDRVIDQWEHGGGEPPADLENLRHYVAGL